MSAAIERSGYSANYFDPISADVREVKIADSRYILGVSVYPIDQVRVVGEVTWLPSPLDRNVYTAAVEYQPNFLSNRTSAGLSYSRITVQIRTGTGFV